MSFRIGRVWLFVAQEEGGDEGVIAENVGGHWLPFVAADETRLEQLKARVQAMPMPSEARITVKLVRFDARTEIETVREPL